ncbi:DNA primase catalytic subunit PriS [uncultured Methanobrevibacter sp.]|uniref:DNA primase catalytic subunit PriS n=1 Tax=uncultured Methanobrevibacter sp. TaxID=253161 RepID=UPI0025886787|nr:DNA primase catalytic subunit PriS [uncultured Methanobrevibacter sp.]
MFGKSSILERREFYREEWSLKDLPSFITDELPRREFGFDHYGKGPNDRYKVFKNPDILRRFLRSKAPFAAYISIAYYINPRAREDWQKAEYVFDVDAKDLPIRSCDCREGEVCPVCLAESLEIVNNLIDTLDSNLGLKNIHLIYSGRGYHIRILDPDMMTADSDLRSEVLKYVAGATVPKSAFPNPNPGEAASTLNIPHFALPIGYNKIFTDRVKYNIQHLRGNEEIDGINKKLMKDIIKFRYLLDDDNWGMFRLNIGPRRYNNLVKAMANVNLSTIDAKVSIDIKRILRLPSSLHSKVSMKCVEVKDRETFDPLKYAVPKFVYERKDESHPDK